MGDFCPGGFCSGVYVRGCFCPGDLCPKTALIASKQAVSLMLTDFGYRFEH